MKKRDWFVVISLLVLTWGLDQITKYWALKSIVDMQFYGPVGLVVHRNPGAILGAFSNLPPVLRIVSLSTGGAFLIFIYVVLQYLLPMRSMQLRSGMSILLGGILGNVTDRIRDGSVVDFLLLGTPEISTPAFNLADATQWIGYGLVVVSLIRDGHQLWPNENFRRKLWINPRFQMKYCLILVACGLGFAIISCVFSYTYLQMTIADLVAGPAQAIEKRFLVPYLEIFSIISLTFMVTLFVIGRILSHRTVGPIYAFEKFLEDVLQGRDRPLRLRAGDEFQHLEELAETVRQQLQSRSRTGPTPAILSKK